MLFSGIFLVFFLLLGFSYLNILRYEIFPLKPKKRSSNIFPIVSNMLKVF